MKRPPEDRRAHFCCKSFDAPFFISGPAFDSERFGNYEMAPGMTRHQDLPKAYHFVN
jgi:hypothetical protein